MNRKPFTTIAIILGAAAAAACSSSEASAPATSTETSAWSCKSIEVPNGGTVECTQESAAAMTVATYDCPLDQPVPPKGCPPPSSEPAPTPPPAPAPDAATSDSGGCMDEGDDTDVEQGGDASGNGNSGKSNNGNGNGGNGNNGNGNNGNGKGGSKHGCSCTGGTAGGDAPAADAGVGGGDGTKPSGGDGTKDSGGYHCSTGEGTCTCTKTPTCAAGSHPSACGACIPDGSTDDCRAPSEGGCWVTGGGFVVDSDGKDTFGGNGMGMKSGTVRGSWEHVDHGTGHNAHGHVRYLSCAVVPGAGPGNPGGKNKGFKINQVKFGGPARWFSNNTWETGYWFDVTAQDHGEPGRNDTYTFSIRKLDAAGVAGPVLYTTTGDLSGGNIQIHPANAGHPAVNAPLPAWVTP